MTGQDSAHRIPPYAATRACHQYPARRCPCFADCRDSRPCLAAEGLGIGAGAACPLALDEVPSWWIEGSRGSFEARRKVTWRRDSSSSLGLRRKRVKWSQPIDGIDLGCGEKTRNKTQ